MIYKTSKLNRTAQLARKYPRQRKKNFTLEVCHTILNICTQTRYKLGSVKKFAETKK
uniref:Uncharacterized protein n=1 Tax=Rhizophora mucronata TaxID=61149 RepID=A0A2P2P192_RHIMU